MKKINASIIVTLLLLVMFASTYPIQLVKGAAITIYINSDGSVNPPETPIVTVDNMTYTFTGNINGSVVIQRNNVIIDGAGYTLRGFGMGDGFYGSQLKNVTIKNSNMKHFEFGIVLDSSSSSLICGNNLTWNLYGDILLSYSYNNTISDNNIKWTVSPWGATDDAGGVNLYGSFNNTIINNNITNNDYGLVLSDSHHNIIAQNTIANNTWEGILLWLSSYNNLSGNAFVNDGLWVGMFGGNEYSHSNVVTNNTVNWKPLVYLENASNQTVTEAGQVVLVTCKFIRIENLDISHLYGASCIELVKTNSTTISGNNITENNATGISLYYSTGNTLSSNTIARNAYGGILLYSSPSNTIIGNNFVNNTQQVYVSGSSPTVWYDGYPSGGNYWSDYTGIDANGDGIGDSPYVIDANNADYYPLMNPPIQGDCNHDGIVDIGDAALLGFWWQQPVPPAPPNVDVNRDAFIDISDAALIGINWQKHA